MPYQELGVALWFFIPALILGVFAYLWLIVKAFGVNAWWGIVVLLFAPAALVFLALNWKAGRAPVALFLVACVIFAGGFVAGQFAVAHDPRVTIVNGEKHLTLTHAKGDALSVIKKHRDVVVLQMAEAELSEETVEHLRGLPELRELDLNDSNVTDFHLAALSGMNKLEILRLNRTAVTDAGVMEHVLPLPSLKELNLRGTKVSTKLLRDWKKHGEKLQLERKFTSGK
jgi:hypothetical protein